jgi:thiopeptide-type bacteriocin biosynthesis protein
MSAPTFEPTGFFALRTALLPVATLLDWTEAGPPESARSASEVDRDALCRRLRRIVSEPEVQDALFLSSPSIWSAMQAWLASDGQGDPKLLRTLVKYVQRIAGRATPFGLFAGCSLGRIDNDRDGIDLAVEPIHRARRHCRIDYRYVLALTRQLLAREDVRRGCRYRLNSSLHRIAGRWRWIARSSTDPARASLETLESDPVLLSLIERARPGARFTDLVDDVNALDDRGDRRDRDDRDDARSADAATFVDSLVERQLLVTELTPTVTGDDALRDLIDQLRAIASPALADIIAALSAIVDRLDELDRAPIGIAPPRYEAVGNALAALGVELDPARSLQVDLIKPAPGARCGRSLMDDVRAAAEVLRRITPEPPDRWQRFRDAFLARYEYREVPLMEALDEESGIGPGWWRTRPIEEPALLRGLPFESPSTPPAAHWTAQDAYLLSRVEDARRAGVDVLDLSDEDVERLASPRPPALPDAFSALIVIGQGEPGAADDIDVLVHHVLGPSGANMMGRFCHADPELRRWVTTHLAAEEALRPDAVFAEIVHLPDGCLGNVIARPPLRAFEIPYAGRSGTGESRQIPVSDLLVTIRGTRVVLRSGRLGRDVIPRLTTMHNFSRVPGVYRFLGTFQEQQMIGWNWGPLNGLARLPRITRGRVVLARAQWRLDRTLLATLTGEWASGVSRASGVTGTLRRWRAANGVPRFVTLPDGETELPVDFENALSVDAFLETARDRADVTLIEMFPAPDRLAAHAPAGRFAHELVIPFVRRCEVKPCAAKQCEPKPPAARADAAEAATTSAVPVRRSYPPGSEWLFVKWYAGPATLDGLLTGVVPPLVARQLDGAADRWFFIRYGDPDWHLRLRFRGEPERLRAGTLGDVCEAADILLRESRISKVQLDTYRREIERYGGDAGIDLAEELFWHDSDAAVRILQLLARRGREEDRWRLCLRAWDLTLTELGLSFEAKHALVKRSRARLARQCGESKSLHRALGDRFRVERRALEALLNDGQQRGHPLQDVLSVLGKRSAQLAPVMHAIRGLAASGRLCQPVEGLAANYLHMTANRLLRASHHEQELVLFDMLDRVYEARSARARGRGRSTASARLAASAP